MGIKILNFKQVKTIQLRPTKNFGNPNLLLIKR